MELTEWADRDTTHHARKIFQFLNIEFSFIVEIRNLEVGLDLGTILDQIEQ